MDLERDLERARQRIAEAEHLVITAGAGIGVDSGLPDFRGTAGFWKAYPPYAALGLSFEALANPSSFSRDPALGWGFYGHRLGLYREVVPHAGFDVLLRWARSKESAFVFTSNVDGQFFRAGFPVDGVYEVHGSIHHLQCSAPCAPDVWPADGTMVDVDLTTMRARPPFPMCPRCGEVARPNILMFGDGGYLDTRERHQEARWKNFLRALKGPVAVVEVGAGTAVPTVRFASEQILARSGATLVRINVRECQGPKGTIGLALGGLEALTRLDIGGASVAPDPQVLK